MLYRNHVHCPNLCVYTKNDHQLESLFDLVTILYLHLPWSMHKRDWYVFCRQTDCKNYIAASIDDLISSEHPCNQEYQQYLLQKHDNDVSCLI